ncbi:MAG: hypothetical protein ACRDZ3_20900 [Acidimicrobiia bacterium]
MARFSVYVPDALWRQILDQWPDFNFSQALRLKLAEVLANGDEPPMYLCEKCGVRVRWPGPAKRARRTAS